ncbi:MAG: hypothetical protein ACRD0Q_00935 [Acidimicrobiales bacterium]
MQARLGGSVRKIGLMVALVVLSGACSDSADDTPAVAPEEKRAPAAEVTAGLRRIEAIVADVAAQAGTDKTKATELSEGIEEEWEPVEGTVKANDQDTYISFEDDFATLEGAAKAGDAAKAKTAADRIAATVRSYTERYPG